MAVVIRIVLRNDPIIAPSLNFNCPENVDQRPQVVPRLLAVLVVVLALVNVSATMLMVGIWASMSTGMLELERSRQDRLIEIFN